MTNKRGFVGLASLIGVTFLLIATVIGVTVVKNRGITLNPNKMAEDVYPTPTGSGCSGSCYYGSSACSSLGLQNGTGSCPGGLCCGSPLTNNCTNGDSYCVDSNTVAVCKVDKSGYTETDCAGGSMCDSAQKKCVSSNAPTPTPTPGSGSTACVGQCFWGISACSTVSRYPSSGTCQGTSICCGDVFSANNCTNGDSYCVDSNTVAVCKVDKSGYTNTDCAAGSKCDSTLKKCTGGGDCAATNQSCTNRSCCNSSDVCQPLPGGKFCVSAGSECTSGQTKCQAEGLTSYVYKCGTGGYWEKERACDAGCEGNFCKKACDPGEKRCSGDELEICNSTGTAWVGQSCVNGCQTTGGTAACKVASCEASACNNQCAQETSGYVGTCSAGECKCSAPKYSENSYPVYPGTTGTPSEEWVQGTSACMNNPEGDECKDWNKQLVKEFTTVMAVTIGAPLTVGGLGPAAAVKLVDFVDDSSQIFRCLVTGDSQACMWAFVALASPVPGASYGDEVTDLVNDIQAVGISRSSLSITEDALSGTTFADDAALSVVNSKYVSGGGQKVIIDPRRDRVLSQTLDNAHNYIAERRTNISISRVPLAQKYVTSLFPNYSGKNVSKAASDAVMAQQEAIYRQSGGTAYLGQFVACQSAVCREQALLLHTVLANQNKKSQVVTGLLPGLKDPKTGKIPKHAWVEYEDSSTHQIMVADAVWDFVLPKDQAYREYGGVTNLLRQVFVTP